MAADRTHPFDVVVALRLLTPSTTLAATAAELAVAPSQVHASLGRLEGAGLLKPGTRSTNTRALGEFILFGVRYAFPALRGRLVAGVPTAHSAPALAGEIDAVDVVVWPAPLDRDAVRGFSIKPLYAKAPRLVSASPGTYRLLTLVDAMRLGDPRSRNAARAQLEQALGWRAGT
ncbi:MAG TPA: hypothetical protein VM764_09225 [Gemmatimonadaceae bacterium]|nr:hypothetical protein [Gemmatimonadaceae bacterium]